MNTQAVDGAAQTAERAVDSSTAERAARFGLASRGVVYLLLGLLAFLVAFGKKGTELDQKGVLQEVAEQPFGAFVVAVLAVGFLCYALWRYSEAVFGPASGEDNKTNRARSAARGVLYSALAFSAVTIVLGARESQSEKQRGFTARVMEHSGGRWLVGIFGLAVLIAGLAMAWNGLRAKFMKHIATDDASPARLRATRRVGRVGVTARGLVFALAGAFVVVAAVQYDPSEAGGINGALKDLRATSYGPYVLALIALGLIAFGVYGLAEARHRRV
jgi:hypothetical protein